MSENVKGYCPMGCGQTLFLGSGGYVTCSYIKCPKPDAVSTILEDRETDHIVELREDGFSITHPLRERIDNALLTCSLGIDLETLPGPLLANGRYRAQGVGGGEWRWSRIS